MSFLRTLTVASLLTLTAGCASGLNSFQENELNHYRANNLVLEEKSPGAGAALGLLPGGGSFYGRSYGTGVVNLLSWPLSMMWDPVSGYRAAESINFQATKAHVARLMERELGALDSQLRLGEIDMKAYALKKRQIEQKYTYSS
ncbi:hypothetical protein [Pseudomonas sp. 6D_7.1_Bac1]|uniref:hypothetical protein n=1 Tax=Pseudomonas sp. 6D_7.1_Bac1 TaxID=2971615 RepID=UPI0021C94F16|nr:hypothetical protein [Pseudomonas sp. 6D_7.1_Bac1]MCU1748789.1 hypothetical protein [Pseudomonas sp. 6D_7.1_Bac1]